MKNFFLELLKIIKAVLVSLAVLFIATMACLHFDVEEVKIGVILGLVFTHSLWKLFEVFKIK